MIITHETAHGESLPHVAPNEWPNPPWNTTEYTWETEYASGTPEWFAQHTAYWAWKTDFHGYTWGRDASVTSCDSVTRDQALQKNQDTSPDLSSKRDRDRDSRDTKSVTGGHAGGHGHTKTSRSQDERPLQCHVAVVTDEHVYYSRDGKLARRQLPGHALSHILQTGLDLGVRGVWILPGSELSRGARREWIGTGGDGWKIKNSQYQEIRDEELCTCLLAYKSKDARADGESGRDLVVMFPEHNDAWAMSRVTNPVTLIKAVTYLEDALGVEIRFKPQTVGRNYMINSNEHNAAKGWIQPVNMVKALPVKPTPISDEWLRPLTDEEIAAFIAQGLAFVDAYDKNSEFPAASTSIKLGVGAPVLVQAPAWEKKTGLYHCIIEGSSPLDGVTLPHPTGGVMDGWFYSYTVELLHDLHYSVTIPEAWIWEESHTILRTWAENFWGARCSLKTGHPECKTERYKDEEARDVAYGACKPVLNASLGMLSAGATRDRLPELEARIADPDLPESSKMYARRDMAWYRPDWHRLVIDRAWALMLRKMLKIREMGAAVEFLGILTDCLYYIASTPDHAQAIPGMMDKRDNLGGFKEKFSCVMTLDDLSEEITRPRANIGKVDGLMKLIEQESEAA